MFKPNAYQQRIFDWIKNGSGNAIVSATAGSGKTSTLTHAARLIPQGEGLFLAFNSHICKELKGRLGRSMEARTIHSIGLEALKATGMKLEAQPNKGKYRDIVKSLLLKAAQRYKDLDVSPLKDPLLEIVRYAMLTMNPLESTRDFYQLTRGYQVEFPADQDNLLRELAVAAMRYGERYVTEQGVYSFDDMVYLPAKWRLSPKRKYAWVFVDETQDLNAAQMEVVSGAIAPEGRALFVGDRSQAIYGFAGADHRSMDVIKDAFNAVEMPLSICYRCPTSHIALAKELDRSIEPAPMASEGVLGELPSGVPLHQYVRDGDLILCRMNAPLIEKVFDLIRHGVPARVRGRDIASGLMTLAETVWKKARAPYWTPEGFELALDAYLQSQKELIRRKSISLEDQDALIAELADKIHALEVINEQAQPFSLEQLSQRIGSLFSEDREGVILSTIHKAKGLEADRVFIVAPEKLPLTTKTAVAAAAERCIEFVALTRAKKALVFVGSYSRFLGKARKPLALLSDGELGYAGDQPDKPVPVQGGLW